MNEFTIFKTSIIKFPSLLCRYEITSLSQIEFSYVFWMFSGFILSLWDHVFYLQGSQRLLPLYTNII